MGVAAMLNLAANAVCLWLLTPYRHGDVNLASAWECSRNDIYEGCAVIVATIAVWLVRVPISVTIASTRSRLSPAVSAGERS